MINAVVVASLLASQASAAPRPCLTREEAGDIALNAAFIGLNAVTARCRSHVSAAAFLNRGAEAMLDRLKAAAEPRCRSAFLAFSRMYPPALPAAASDADSGPEKGAQSRPRGESNDSQDERGSRIPQFDPATNPELTAQLVTVMASAAISTVDIAACADANDFMEALAPLPPQNIARLAGAGLGIAGTVKPGAADSLLCAR